MSDEQSASGDAEAEPQRLFTIEQANAMLPLVRAIVKDLVELARDVIERRQRLANLTHDGELEPGDPYHQESMQIEEELEKDRQRLHEYIRELRQLGAEPKDGTLGLVDFPAIIDGRTVYLCWKLDEPEILFWHDLDAGFAGRQPLPPAGPAVITTAASGSAAGGAKSGGTAANGASGSA